MATTKRYPRFAGPAGSRTQPMKSPIKSSSAPGGMLVCLECFVSYPYIVPKSRCPYHPIHANLDKYAVMVEDVLEMDAYHKAEDPAPADMPPPRDDEVWP